MACLQGEQATWDNVLTWLSSTTSKAAVQECAVALLSAVASRALTPNLHLRSHQLWSIPVLQLQPVTRPTLVLICAAFAGGVSMLTHVCMDGELHMGKCMTSLCILHMCCCTSPPLPPPPNSQQWPAHLQRHARQHHSCNIGAASYTTHGQQHKVSNSTVVML